MKNSPKFIDQTINDIREYILNYLEENNISSEEFAEILGLLPIGGQIMTSRHWTLGETFWILEQMSDHIKFTVELGVKMKTKDQVMKTRSNGLKHFDAAIAKSSRTAILDKTLEFAKMFPDVWGVGWNNLLWAAMNAVGEILNKEIQQSWNLDEVFTEEEMKYLAKEMGIKLEDYKPMWERKEVK